MPTLVAEDPDNYDIDYYYARYKDRHGVGMMEAKPQNLYVLPIDFDPITCEVNSSKNITTSKS